MSRAADVCAGLLKHKSILLRELTETNVLDVLVKKGLFSLAEHEEITGEIDGDRKCGRFVEVVSKYSAVKLSEVCGLLERECPELTRELIQDRDRIITNGYYHDNTKENMVMDHNLNRESPRSRRSVSQCSCSTASRPPSRRSAAASPPPAHLLNNTVEMYVEPVVEDTGERGGVAGGWETHRVRLSRVPGYGFGIAVSGGRDNPHFASGDPSIAVSDVLRGGPAEDKLQVNDRIVSVNGVGVENVEYARAVQVLRESGASVSLVVRRRAPAPPSVAATTIKLALTRHAKKEEFGVVLGCKLYVKELTLKAREQLNTAGQGLCEGDVVTKINNTVCGDTMTLKEARKLMEACKERLELVVTRDLLREETVTSHNQYQNNYASLGSDTLSASYSGQNLYVAAPSRPGGGGGEGGGRRGPLSSHDLTQLEQPPRPPPPRNEDYYSSRRQLYEEEAAISQRNKPPGEPRLISFQKEGSVGLRLSGGNRSGVFVSGVQPTSPAALQGLQPADKILKVNDMEMAGVTREEAVLFLLSLQERIDLIVQHAPLEYNAVAAAHTPGDSFHIKTHFHYAEPTDGEMSFRCGDVFHVVDTLHNGTVGAWQVFRIGRNNQEVQKGIIPNKARAEELATAQFNANKKELSGGDKSGFFRRRRSTHRRTKSLGKEHWDEVVLSDSISKFPAYERVVLRQPGSVRPVVLFGVCADIARERLLTERPDKFASPHVADGGGEESKSGSVIRLSSIRAIMERGKHALLDVTPAAVDRLNYAQFYPIVVFVKADNKSTVKRLRQGLPKSAHKSSKKLMAECQRLERSWGHVFTHTISLSDANLTTWYAKLGDIIARTQQQQLWVSETKHVDLVSDIYFPIPLAAPAALTPASRSLPDRYRSRSPSADRTRSHNQPAPYYYSDAHRPTDLAWSPSRRPYSAPARPRRPASARDPQFRTASFFPEVPATDTAVDPATQCGRPCRISGCLCRSAGAPYRFSEVRSLPPETERLLNQTRNLSLPSLLAGREVRRGSDSIAERTLGYRAEPLSDDFLFALGSGGESRLSYASSPESDLDVSPPPAPRLAKASSDPSVATAQDAPDREDMDLALADPPPYTSGYGDSKYGFSTSLGGGGAGEAGAGQYARGPPPSTHSPHSSHQSQLYGIVPELPPRTGGGGGVGGGGGTRPVGGVLLPGPTPGRPLQPLRAGGGAGAGAQRPSAQERLFGPPAGADDTADYVHRAAPAHDRHPSTAHYNNNMSQSVYEGGGGVGGGGGGAGAYDYGGGVGAAHEAGARLGPNAPDDMKVAPPGKLDPPPPPPASLSPHRVSNSHEHVSLDYRPSDPAAYNRSGESMYRGGHLARAPPPAAAAPPAHARGPSLPAPPSNNDYAKYSSGARPADYGGVAGSRPLSGSGGGGAAGGAAAYKPVPPPKPKHYRQPGGGGDVASPHHHKSYSHGNGAIDPAARPPPPSNGYGYYGSGGGAGGGVGGGGGGAGWQHSHSHSQPDHYAHHRYSHHQSMYGGGGGAPPQSPPYAGPPPPKLHPAPPHNPNHIDLAGSREQRGSAFELYRKPQHVHSLSSDAAMDAHFSPKTKKKLSKKPSFIKNAVLDLFRSKSRSKVSRQRSMCENDSAATAPRLRREKSDLTDSSVHRHNTHVRNHMLRRSNSSCDRTAPPPAPQPALRRQSSFCEGASGGPGALRRQSSMYEVHTEKTTPLLRRQRSLMEYDRRGFNLITEIDPVYRRAQLPPPPAHAQPLYRSQEVIYDPIPKPRRTYASVYGHMDASTANASLASDATENPYGNRQSVESPYAVGGRSQSGKPSDYIYGESPYASKEQMLKQRTNPENPYATKEEMLRQRFSESPYGTREDFKSRIGAGVAREPIYGTRTYEPPAGATWAESPAADTRRLLTPVDYPARILPMHKSMSEPPYGTIKCASEPPYTSRSEMLARESPYGARGAVEPVERRPERPASAECAYVSRQEILSQKAAALADKESACGMKLEEKLEIIKQRNQAKKELIYQSRREVSSGTSDVTAAATREPVYVSKRELKESIIYESQQEAAPGDDSPYELSDANHLSRHRSPTKLGDAFQEIDFAALRLSESRTDTEKEKCLQLAGEGSVLKGEATYTPRLPTKMTHISTALKATEPAPHESTASMETHYASECSMNFGTKPQSTPYTSQDLGEGVGKPAHGITFCEQIVERSAESSQNNSDTLASGETTVVEGGGMAEGSGADGVEPERPHTTWGIFDSEGGVLEDRQWGVSLVIPPKAIAPGIKQKIYFTVSDPRHSQRVGGPPIDMDNGEAMLSPLVMCGPQGLVFLRPVTLRLPHCANAVPSLGLTLKATDTEAHLSTDWDNIHLPATTTLNTVAVRVDHF